MKEYVEVPDLVKVAGIGAMEKFLSSGQLENLGPTERKKGIIVYNEFLREKRQEFRDLILAGTWDKIDAGVPRKDLLFHTGLHEYEPFREFLGRSFEENKILIPSVSNPVHEHFFLYSPYHEQSGKFSEYKQEFNSFRRLGEKDFLRSLFYTEHVDEFLKKSFLLKDAKIESLEKDFSY